MRTLVVLTVTLAFALTGCTGPVTAHNASVDESTPARKLYVSKCAKCHKLYDPAKYSEEDWQLWMDKMSKKAKLKPEQKEALSRYIENNFRTGRLKPLEKK